MPNHRLYLLCSQAQIIPCDCTKSQLPTLLIQLHSHSCVHLLLWLCDLQATPQLITLHSNLYMIQFLIFPKQQLHLYPIHCMGHHFHTQLMNSIARWFLLMRVVQILKWMAQMQSRTMQTLWAVEVKSLKVMKKTYIVTMVIPTYIIFTLMTLKIIMALTTLMMFMILTTLMTLTALVTLTIFAILLDLDLLMQIVAWHVVFPGHPFIPGLQYLVSIFCCTNQIADCLTDNDFNISPNEDECQALAALHGTPKHKPTSQWAQCSLCSPTAIYLVKAKGRGMLLHQFYLYPRHLHTL